MTGDNQRPDGQERGGDASDDAVDASDDAVDASDDAVDASDDAVDASDGGDPLAWETKRREVTYECPGFDIVREDVELPDGTQTDFDYLVDDPAVVLLAFTPDGDVVLVEEWRQAVGRVNRALPAGGVEDGDADFAAAARRELSEETGHEAASVEKVGEFEPANGISNAVHHYYVARGCEPTAEQDLDFNESIRVTTQPYDDLLAAVRNGEIRDGRTALGVLQYELR